MDVIKESDVSEHRLDELGVKEWTSWEKETSEFDWSYSSTETCYVQNGQFTVHLPNGESLTAEAGDIVQFPAGLDCKWEITDDIQKVFILGDRVELNQSKGKVISVA